MKLKPEHYAIIRDAVKCVATPQKVTRHREQIEKDIAASGRQMDGNRRLRWDCLYAARLGPWLSENDEHIDTALRRIVGEIEQAALEMGVRMSNESRDKMKLARTYAALVESPENRRRERELGMAAFLNIFHPNMDPELRRDLLANSFKKDHDNLR